MSQPARRPLPPPPPAAGAFEDTGRFRIDERPRPETVLPPAAERAEFLSLDELGAVLESSPSLPAVPEPGATPLASGIFDKAAEAVPEGEGIAPLEPYYRGTELKSERAELEIQDLSLQYDNPFLASSLVPPAREPRAAPRSVWIAGLAVAALAASIVGLLMRPATSSRPVARPHRVPAARSQPVRVSLPVETAAPAPVATPTPKATPLAAEVPSAIAPAPVASPKPVPRPARLEKGALSAEPSAPSAVAQPSASKPGPSKPEPTQPAAEAPQAILASARVAPSVPGIEQGDVEAPATSAPPTIATESGDVTEALPELPAREDVVAALEQTRGSLVACAGQKHGIANADITIANSGRVSRVLIDGVFQGTPEGSCMARAIRAAHVARFSQPSLKVGYPFAL